MRYRYLCKSNFASDIRHQNFVSRVQITVQERDGNCPHTAIICGLQRHASHISVKRGHNGAVGIQPFEDFGNIGIQKVWSLDIEVKQSGAVLIADAQ